VKRGSKRSPKRLLEFRLQRSTAPNFPSHGPESIHLDVFTDADVANWDRLVPQVQEYHYRFFYELEAQRAAVKDRIRDALATVRATSVNLEGWGRALDWQYCLNPLSAVGSLRWVGGRFNFGVDIDSDRFPAFPALYLAEDFGTALAERLGAASAVQWGGKITVADLALCGESSFTWVCVTGEIKNVFDLTVPQNLDSLVDVIKKFEISGELRALEAKVNMRYQTISSNSEELLKTFMVDHWRLFAAATDLPSNSQILGNMLCSAGFEAVLYRSVRTHQRNLAVFTRQLTNSESEIHAPTPQPAGVILSSLTSANWREAELEYEELKRRGAPTTSPTG
jgi:RES domain-containing protein